MGNFHSKMKILFCLDSLELGGAERQALLLAEHLQSEGCDILLWGLGKPGKVSMLCDEKKIIWESKFSWIQKSLHKEIYGFLKMILDIKRFSPSIIIPFCTIPSLLCALTWRFTKTRACIWNERDIGLFHMLQQAYPFAFKLSTCIVANSIEGKNFLQKNYGDDLDIRVINNGVHISPPGETRKVWKEKLGAEESALIVCMVANIHKRKNHQLLIEAWNEAIISSIIPNNSMLVFAGHEFDAEHLKNKVLNYGLQNNIKFLGAVDDIAGLLSAVDIGVLSSFNEGQPNALLEYMQAGLPIIASDLPCIRELLQDTDSILFKNDSINDFIAAIEQMSFVDRRREAGLRNREICKQKYLSEQMFAEYKTLFDELLNKKRPKLPLFFLLSIFIFFSKYYFNRIRNKVLRATI